jgi:hypothetical protein
MKKIDSATRRRLAVLASCDPRTLDKALRSEPIRGLAGHRARAILRDARLLPPELPTASAKEAGHE